MLIRPKGFDGDVPKSKKASKKKKQQDTANENQPAARHAEPTMEPLYKPVGYASSQSTNSFEQYMHAHTRIQPTKVYTPAGRAYGMEPLALVNAIHELQQEELAANAANTPTLKAILALPPTPREDPNHIPREREY